MDRPALRKRVDPLRDPLDAVVQVPGSKSITNRALVCAALAGGSSRLEGALLADDTRAMLECLRRLGVPIEIEAGRGGVVIDVAGRGGSAARSPEAGMPSDPDDAGAHRWPGPGPLQLDARLSGTTARFVAPLLALGAGPYLLDGADPLRRRPMADGIDVLRSLGATVVEVGEAGHLPIEIHGQHLAASLGNRAPRVVMRAGTSSQFVSGTLLSAPSYPGGLRLELAGPVVSRPYVDLTVDVMAAFGVTVGRPDPSTCAVPGGEYVGTTYAIEPDASAASYFFAAAAIAGGKVRVDGLGRTAIQGDMAFLDVLERMGATIARGDRHSDVAMAPGSALRGVDADLTDCSDTAQTLAMVAVFADAPTTITGIGFIRRKETDRIHAMVTELRRCGIQVDELDDGIRVYPGTPVPAAVHTYDDHRMAMSFALLGLRVPGIEILEPDCVEKTFPAFWEVLRSLRGGGNARTPSA